MSNKVKVMSMKICQTMSLINFAREWVKNHMKNHKNVKKLERRVQVSDQSKVYRHSLSRMGLCCFAWEMSAESLTRLACNYRCTQPGAILGPMHWTFALSSSRPAFNFTTNHHKQNTRAVSFHIIAQPENVHYALVFLGARSRTLNHKRKKQCGKFKWYCH